MKIILDFLILTLQNSMSFVVSSKSFGMNNILDWELAESLKLTCPAKMSKCNCSEKSWVGL